MVQNGSVWIQSHELTKLFAIEVDVHHNICAKPVNIESVCSRHILEVILANSYNTYSTSKELGYSTSKEFEIKQLPELPNTKKMCDFRWNTIHMSHFAYACKMEFPA